MVDTILGLLHCNKPSVRTIVILLVILAFARRVRNDLANLSQQAKPPNGRYYIGYSEEDCGHYLIYCVGVCRASTDRFTASKLPLIDVIWILISHQLERLWSLLDLLRWFLSGEYATIWLAYNSKRSLPLIDVFSMPGFNKSSVRPIMLLPRSIQLVFFQRVQNGLARS